jgi:hypothetical protein
MLGKKSNKYDPKITDALRELLKWFRSLSVPSMVIGGVAASLLGKPRVTKDIDALVLVEEGSWEDFLEHGKKWHFVARIADPLSFAMQTRVFLLVHKPTKVNIDISVGSLPFEMAAVSRKLTVKVGRLNLPLPTPEDLIIMKAIPQRPRDIADIGAVLDVHSDLDTNWIRKWTQELTDILEAPELFINLDRLLVAYEKQQRIKRR